MLGLPPDFWDNERFVLLAVLRPRLEQMASTAMQQAAGKLGIGFDNSLANQDAAQWARDYTDRLLQQLGTTDQNVVGSILSDWISREGATRGELEEALKPHFSAQRASTIAVTETTRAYAEGERMAYIREGIQEWRWQTNRDELVCEICGPLNGKAVRIGTPFGKDKKGNPVTAPPAHVNCRCWVRPVVESRQAQPEVVQQKPTMIESSQPAPSNVPMEWQPSMDREQAEIWNKDSQYQEDVYHVTLAKNVDSIKIKSFGFDLSRSHFGRVWGEGVYLGTGTNEVKMYTRWILHTGTPKTLIIKTNLSKIYEIDVSDQLSKNSLDRRWSIEYLKDAVQDVYGLSSRDEVELLLSQYKKENKTNISEKRATIELLKEKGYNALHIISSIAEEVYGGDQLVVFDPRNVVVLK